MEWAAAACAPTEAAAAAALQPGCGRHSMHTATLCHVVSPTLNRVSSTSSQLNNVHPTPDSQRIKLACKIKDEYAAAQHFDAAQAAARGQQASAPAGAPGPAAGPAKPESKSGTAKLIDSIPVAPRCVCFRVRYVCEKGDWVAR